MAYQYLSSGQWSPRICETEICFYSKENRDLEWERQQSLRLYQSTAVGWVASVHNVKRCQKITRIVISHCEGDMDICTNFHGNLSKQLFRPFNQICKIWAYLQILSDSFLFIFLILVKAFGHFTLFHFMLWPILLPYLLLGRAKPF